MNSFPRRIATGTADARAKRPIAMVDFGRRSATYTNGS